MPLTYGSVCSGIEAASVAWEVLGWRPSWFSQFDPEHNYKNGPDFPSAVLAHHWPHVKNLGDMTKIAAAIRLGEIEAPDVLVGGTPCQAFSIAGLRNGLTDSRGQLTLAFVELVNAIDEKRREQGKPPVIVVWENVPGVFSSRDNAFGCFLAGLAGESRELESPGRKWTNAGYVLGPERAVCWRVLDAQFFGVAQRRRRVFVIASARGDIDPAKILFESEGMRRDTPPRRETGEIVAALIANGVGVCGADDNQGQAGHLIAMAHGQAGAEIKTDDSAPTLTCNHEAPIVFSCNGHASFTPGVSALRTKSGADHETLAVHGTQDPDTLKNLAHTLGRNHGQENAVAYCLQHAQINRADNAGPQGKGWQEECRFTLDSRSCADAVAYAFKAGQGAKAGGIGWAEEQSPTLTAASSGSNLSPSVVKNMAVRRLTPVECERLQGFPDNHTLIPRDKRKQITADEYAYARHHNPKITAEEAYRLAKDGPRYKAIGNSMAVPVMRWIGRRISNALEQTI